MSTRHLLLHAYGDPHSSAVVTAIRAAHNARAAFPEPENVTIHIVVQGGAVQQLLPQPGDPDNFSAITADGTTEILACENSLHGSNLTPSDLADGVTTTPAAVAYLAQKQWDGWAYIRL